MSHLLLDIGNTRIKWCLADGLQPGPVQVLVLGPRDAGARLRALLHRAGPVADIWVSNVAGAPVARALRRAAAAERRPRPRFVSTSAQAGGVRNAYRDPWRLGVDRWLALIGARARYRRRAVCIVGVGTALTIDLLDASGRHRGGLIAPGPTLMRESLLRQTAGIRRRARGGPRAGVASARAFFARSTSVAIEEGAAQACAALVERALDRAQRLLRTRPRLLLAGGSAGLIAARLGCEVLLDDELVLRGLAVLAHRQRR